jgi:hypothetical protein
MADPIGSEFADIQRKKTFRTIFGFFVIKGILILIVMLVVLLSGCSRQDGKVLNIADSSPIAGATIFHDGQLVRSDANGRFRLKHANPGKPVLVKAAGYRQASIPVKRYLGLDARLQPFEAKALYLSHAGLGAASLRGPVLDLIDNTSLNTLVIDIKGVRGLISFAWEIPLGYKIGAFANLTVEKPRAFVQEMHKKNIYLVARISVFKDNALGYHMPQWAVMDKEKNKPYRDHEEIVWMDPFQEPVWDYNIALAKGAAELGFDEILFDNVRFPAVKTNELVQYSGENTEGARLGVVTNFLRKASQELSSYPVFISTAISGSVLWRQGDADIGQNLEAITPLVDYVWPYVYPSDLPAGPLKLKTSPAKIPRQAVLAVLANTVERTGEPPQKFRPWLQSFRDYSQAGGEFKEEGIALQIEACSQAKTGGWVIFNPENKYPYVAGAMRRIEDGAKAEQAQR